MGLDLLDVAFRVEKTFGVPLAANDFEQLVRDRDIVVGDLYELILRRVHARDTVRNDVRLNFALWEELQQQLGAAAGVPADEVQLKMPLELLFPPSTRRAAWERLRTASRYRIPTLDYPWPVRPIGFSLALAMALLEQFRIWQAAGVLWLWPILGLVGIWMFAESYGKVIAVLAAWRIRFPGGMKLVKDLARAVVATDYQTILAGSPKGLVGSYDLPANDRCLAIWQQLQEILADALGVKVEEIALKSRLIADLGAN
jgi:acyl carrier protein